MTFSEALERALMGYHVRRRCWRKRVALAIVGKKDKAKLHNVSNGRVAEPHNLMDTGDMLATDWEARLAAPAAFLSRVMKAIKMMVEDKHFTPEHIYDELATTLATENID